MDALPTPRHERPNTDGDKWTLSSRLPPSYRRMFPYRASGKAPSPGTNAIGSLPSHTPTRSLRHKLFLSGEGPHSLQPAFLPENNFCAGRKDSDRLLRLLSQIMHINHSQNSRILAP